MKNCDSVAPYGTPYVVATFSSPTSQCNGEEYNARFSLISESGDVPPGDFSGEYIKKTSSASAMANGVEGTRETFRYLKDTTLPPPVGTDRVRYVFVTGGRTCVIGYFHYPDEPDRTKDFDTLVTETLRFR
jgi:hypothetical protein